MLDSNALPTYTTMNIQFLHERNLVGLPHLTMVAFNMRGYNGEIRNIVECPKFLKCVISSFETANTESLDQVLGTYRNSVLELLS